jgi:hypothetical protein
MRIDQFIIIAEFSHVISGVNVKPLDSVESFACIYVDALSTITGAMVD